MTNGRKTIGVMIGNANSPHTIETIHGICEAAKELDVNVIIFVGMHSSYFFREYFQKENQEDYDYQSMCVFDYRRLCDCDAMIVAYGTLSVFLNEKELKELQKSISEIPTVFLESKIETKSSRYLIADNYTGIRQIMDHLTQFHGYRNIVYLSGPVGNVDADERRRGYVDSMAEAGLEISETSIEYGDFSERVENQVNRLLDNNPDVEALVCANDVMAITAYEVIARRAKLFELAAGTGDEAGIKRYKKHIIGDSSSMGIAVTGYDNTSDAGNIEPPLTTVAQSPYSYGYMAVKSAIRLIDNPESAESITAMPKVVTRQSCGCRAGLHLEFPEMNERYRVSPELYASTAAEIYTNGLLPVEINEALSNKVYDIIYEIILKHVKRYLGISGEAFSSDEILEDTKKFLSSDVSRYIPRMTFVSAFNDYMMGILKNAKEGPMKDILIDAEAKISDYVYSKLFAESRDALAVYRHRTWFMPLISRDMANNLSSPEKMYYEAMSKLNVLGLGDSYLFILRETKKHRRNEKWTCPEELILVADTEGGEAHSYDLSSAPVVSSDRLLNELIFSDDGCANASVLNLYSGEVLYGVLVAKAEPEDVLSVYYAAVQISTALKYCETANAQQRAQSELQKIIREVEDKNEILRSLSEYDQLTGCYNRRGFLEKGLSMVKDNIGKKACMIYADLDHLKEINDRYGHSEGDFAIENVAKNIRMALPESAIIGRLGGDEFTAMFIMTDEMDADEFAANISNMSVRFNAISAKPFYVECSVGCSTFTCEMDTSLEDVMAKADNVLYDAKRRRRQSIVKKIMIL